MENVTRNLIKDLTTIQHTQSKNFNIEKILQTLLCLYVVFVLKYVISYCIRH